MVLDLDDATYIAYSSPTYGALASLVKCFGKTTDLLRWADVVTCGNEVIAKHAIAAGKNAMILPTTVDHNIFQPGPGRLAQPPVLGWIGTHSTYPFMEALLPTLEQLAEHHSFRVLIVGSGRAGARFKNLQVEFRDWSLTRETADFQSISIGLYPLEETPYANGKSGFKAIQYMMLGIPFVVSPVGICRTLGEPGRTHLLARTSDEWLEALKLLLCDTHRARLMGQAGRDFALRHYKLETLASTLGEALRVAATSNA
jgi:glycosyltransferase involved in cell wall biosynthesis